MRSAVIQSKFLGGMLGHALGDSIGELAFEFPAKGALQSIIKQKKLLTYTDDTAMAIGIAESLVKRGSIDINHLGEIFRQNFEREPWRGYAPGPPTVFSLVKQGYTYQDAAQSLFQGTGSFGNGAAMRITPIGLYYHDSEDLIARTGQSAVVTHSHPLSLDGAAILASAVAMVVSLTPETEFSTDPFLNRLRKIPKTPEFKDKLSLVSQLINDQASQQYAAQELGTNVLIHESVPYALYSFIKNPNSFSKCLFHAVLVK